MQEEDAVNQNEMQGVRTLLGVEEAVAGGAAVAWLAYGGSGRCCGGSNGGERDFSLFCVFVSFFPFVFGLFRYSLSASLFLLFFCLFGSF